MSARGERRCYDKLTMDHYTGVNTRQGGGGSILSEIWHLSLLLVVDFLWVAPEVGSNEGQIQILMFLSTSMFCFFVFLGICTLLILLSLSTFWHKYRYFLLLSFSVPNITWLFSTHQCIRKGKWCQRRIKMERNVVLVSGICRDPAALCLDFLFKKKKKKKKVFLSLGRHKILVFDSLEMRRNNQQSFWCIYEWPPADSI